MFRGHKSHVVSGNSSTGSSRHVEAQSVGGDVFHEGQRWEGLRVLHGCWDDKVLVLLVIQEHRKEAGSCWSSGDMDLGKMNSLQRFRWAFTANWAGRVHF